MSHIVAAAASNPTFRSHDGVPRSMGNPASEWAMVAIDSSSYRSQADILTRLEAKLDNLTLNLDIVKRKVTGQESALVDVDATLQDLKAMTKATAVSLDSTNKLAQEGMDDIGRAHSLLKEMKVDLDTVKHAVGMDVAVVKLDVEAMKIDIETGKKQSDMDRNLLNNIRDAMQGK
ncbi:hypothetical protein P692DRAFT_20822242 [Suillus brevipes Sb2]|nr:hypothetical protein P692DRAFT_20822242 [Suillus brevipes Sb2]